MTVFDRVAGLKSAARDRLNGYGRVVLALAQALRAMIKIADALSEWCRLVRAYSDLTRLGNRTLQQVGRRPAELDRILHGLPPRRYRDRD